MHLLLFRKGFGKRLIPRSASLNQSSILAHDPFPVHPDRSITQRDYRGLPALDNPKLASSILTATRKKSSGHWMRSCYDDWGQNIERVPNELIYRNDFKRLPVHPWQY
jgi:hypothetical protein